MKTKKGVFRKVTNVVLRGTTYRLSWRKPRAKDDVPAPLGLCDPPTLKHRTITIDPNVEEEELLDTIVHELTHGCIWDLKESVVGAMASDITRILWDCGYRRQEQPKD